MSWARRWAPSPWSAASWSANCRRIRPQIEDARLLREQAERCRGILTRLARPEQSVLDATQRMPLGAVLDDLAGPYRGEELEIAIHLEPARGRAGRCPRSGGCPNFCTGWAI